MNANQINSLKTAAARNNRKESIQVLKALRAEGVKILIDLRAKAEAVAAEVARLLATVAEGATEAVKTVIKVASTPVKANLTYWASTPVKGLNSRANKGAIALYTKLFGV